MKQKNLSENDIKVIRATLVVFGVEQALCRAPEFAKRIPAFKQLNASIGNPKRKGDKWAAFFDAQLKVCATDAQARAVHSMQVGNIFTKSNADEIDFHLDLALLRDSFPATKGGLNHVIKAIGLPTSTAEKIYRSGRKIREFISEYEQRHPTQGEIAKPADFGGYKKLLEFSSMSCWKTICDGPEKHRYFLFCNPTIIKRYGAANPPAKLSEVGVEGISRIIKDLCNGKETPQSLTHPRVVKPDSDEDSDDGSTADDTGANAPTSVLSSSDRINPRHNVAGLIDACHKIHTSIRNNMCLLEQQIRRGFADVDDPDQWIMQMYQAAIQNIYENLKIVAMVQDMTDEGEYL